MFEWEISPEYDSLFDTQAPQFGWETWFSLQYGTDLSKLKTRVEQRKPKNLKKTIKKLTEEAAKQQVDLSATQPTSKYHLKRVVNLRHLKQTAEWLKLLQQESTQSTIATTTTSSSSTTAPSTEGE
eukprot:TRINITY_DN65400_c0_g1_i1.p1 TRINITY_DN65400_c0_g1~~TRINITY_DN65400_c0_g1_i1.p1  ORF type:complete len:126 (+),score=22.81 TRINITY_DN65400_c0_g1_i1:785-1162(+)